MKQTRTFKFALKINDANEVFLDGEEPGVIGVQEIEFTGTEEEFMSQHFALKLSECQEKLIKECVTVSVEEIESDK